MDRGLIRWLWVQFAFQLQSIDQIPDGFADVFVDVWLDLVVDHLLDDPRRNQPIFSKEAVADAMHRVEGKEELAEKHLVDLAFAEPAGNLRLLQQF